METRNTREAFKMDLLVARAVLVLAASRQFDTADIADIVVEPEHFVVWLIEEAKAGRVSFAAEAGIVAAAATAAVHPASEGA